MVELFGERERERIVKTNFWHLKVIFMKKIMIVKWKWNSQNDWIILVMKENNENEVLTLSVCPSWSKQTFLTKFIPGIQHGIASYEHT